MLVLDAGAFVAVERGDRAVVALVKRERLAGRPPVTSGAVDAQSWRGGRDKQVPVAMLLAGTSVVPVDDGLVGARDAAGAQRRFRRGRCHCGVPGRRRRRDPYL